MRCIRGKHRIKVKRSRLTLSDANKDQSVRKIGLRAKMLSKIKRYVTGFNISSRALLPCINFLRGKMNLIPRVSREKSKCALKPTVFFVRRERLGFYVNPTSPRLVYTGRNIVTRGILWPRNTLSITVGNRKPSKNAWAVTKHVFNYTLQHIGAAGNTQLRSTRNIFFLWRWIVNLNDLFSRNVIIKTDIS